MAKKIIRATTNIEYLIIGLKTTLNDYKIAWKLNNSLNSEFKNFENSTLNFYTSTNPLKMLFWENSSQNFLLKDLLQFNFIIKIFSKNETTNEVKNNILSLFNNDIISIIEIQNLTKKSQAFISKLDF
ncbi:MAG: hypothetical protein JXR68_00230 [Bacteroidales bacterium]|nr:hypothetical protein [Bacteroidales bacterium]